MFSRFFNRAFTHSLIVGRLGREIIRSFQALRVVVVSMCKAKNPDTKPVCTQINSENNKLIKHICNYITSSFSIVVVLSPIVLCSSWRNFRAQFLTNSFDPLWAKKMWQKQNISAIDITRQSCETWWRTIRSFSACE